MAMWCTGMRIPRRLSPGKLITGFLTHVRPPDIRVIESRFFNVDCVSWVMLSLIIILCSNSYPMPNIMGYLRVQEGEGQW
jgi:hypothetical protein